MEKSFLICNMPDSVTDCYMKTILWRRNALFWWPCDSHACLDILEFSKLKQILQLQRNQNISPNI